MPVIGKNFGQSVLAHRLHGDAIRQALAFIGPRSVESHAREKRFPTLRNNLDARVFENALGIGNSFAAHRLGSHREEGKILGQHFIRGDDGRVCPIGGKSQSAPVGAVGGIGQGDPIERIGEKSGHSSFLGPP